MSWSPPVDDGGLLQRYLISYGDAAGWDGDHSSPTDSSFGFDHTVSADPDASVHELFGEHVVSNRTYVIRIRAQSSAGIGPTDNVTLVCTPGDISPPSDPVSVTTSNPSASTVFVSWGSPNDLGGAPREEVSFVVLAGLADEGDGPGLMLLPEGDVVGGWVAGETAFQYMLVSGLNHSTSYRFAVAASNSGGLGPSSLAS